MALVGAIDRLIVHWQASSRRRVPAQRLVDELARVVVATLSAP